MATSCQHRPAFGLLGSNVAVSHSVDDGTLVVTEGRGSLVGGTDECAGGCVLGAEGGTELVEGVVVVAGMLEGGGVLVVVVSGVVVVVVDVVEVVVVVVVFGMRQSPVPVSVDVAPFDQTPDTVSDVPEYATVVSPPGPIDPA